MKSKATLEKCRNELNQWFGLRAYSLGFEKPFVTWYHFTKGEKKNLGEIHIYSGTVKRTSVINDKLEKNPKLLYFYFIEIITSILIKHEIKTVSIGLAFYKFHEKTKKYKFYSGSFE